MGTRPSLDYCSILDKVDIDFKDKLGKTPLLLAAEYGNEAIFKLLLDTGKVNVDSKDDDG
jgi:ankyrin repeat protein